MGTDFEVSRLYFGIYSMSGITLRFSFGFVTDPYYCNAALMRKTAKVVNKKSKEAAQRAVEDQKNAKIEAWLFELDPKKKNPGRFRTMIKAGRNLLTNNPFVREKFD